MYDTDPADFLEPFPYSCEWFVVADFVHAWPFNRLNSTGGGGLLATDYLGKKGEMLQGTSIFLGLSP